MGIQAVRAFADADVPLTVAIEVSQSTVACALMRAGAGLALLDGLAMMGTPATDLVMRPFYPSIQVKGRLVRPRHLLPSRLAHEFVDTLNDVIAIHDRCSRDAETAGTKPPLKPRADNQK